MERVLVDGRKMWGFLAALMLGLTGTWTILMGFGTPDSVMGVPLIVTGAACIAAVVPAFACRMGVAVAVLVAGVMLAAMLTGGIVSADIVDAPDGLNAPGITPPVAAGESRSMECTAAKTAGAPDWTLTCVP